MSTYHLTIPGTPVPKARPRVTRSGHAYTTAKTRDYEELVQWLFVAKHGKPLLTGPVYAHIKIFLPIPKNVSKKRRAELARETTWHTKKPDADNVVKALLDSLNGIAFADDSRVAWHSAMKLYSENPRVELTLESLQHNTAAS